MTKILAPEIVSELGEGPLWSNGQLYWFDILGKRLHACAPDAAEPRTWQFDEHFSAAGRIAGGLILASETALWRFDPETGTREHLIALEADRPETRSNDGRADRQGGFWIGTMGKTDPTAQNGALYRYYRGKLRLLRTGVAIPNAICFAPDGRRGYFADTVQDRIFTWTLDAEGWPEAEPEVFFDFAGATGGPDGAVVDSEGALWVALWGGSRVLRIRVRWHRRRRDHNARQPDHVPRVRSGSAQALCDQCLDRSRRSGPRRRAACRPGLCRGCRGAGPPGADGDTGALTRRVWSHKGDTRDEAGFQRGPTIPLHSVEREAPSFTRRAFNGSVGRTPRSC